MTLGETSLDETLAAWGQPIERETEGDQVRCRFVIEPFASVDVTFNAGTAQSIIVDLGKVFAMDDVAKELGIEAVTPVSVDDENGRSLGVVYPERGVSFRFSDAEKREVVQIGLDVIDPRPFLLRAENNLTTFDSAALADVEAALKLDPENARAHWLRARLLSAAGRRREALASIETALKQDPKGAEYLLMRADLLAEAGLFDAALDDGEAVLNGTPGSPHLQAKAWLLRGDLLADGPDRDYEQAIDAHSRAIRLAEPLVNDPRPSVRRAAKDILIDAHLAIAEDVAWGNWQQKELVVPQWLMKAERLAEAWIASGDVSPDLRITIGHRALATCVGLQGTFDPHVWAESLQRRTTESLAECRDPLRRQRLQWEAGLGLYDALQSYHARSDTAEALKCGEAAVELLAQGREGRDELPTDAYMFGRLYFRIGSIYAVKRTDHAKAVEWFERAAPLLERPLPEAAAADRGRQGETLVSMGVSYWAVGKRERGLELTNVGSRYMQLAAADGTMPTAALAVPYTNLSVMHRQLGDESAGVRFAEMATRLESTAMGLRR